MALDEPKDSDHTTELNDVTYLIDQDLSEKVGTVNVDYVDKGAPSGKMTYYRVMDSRKHLTSNPVFVVCQPARREEAVKTP